MTKEFLQITGLAAVAVLAAGLAGCQSPGTSQGEDISMQNRSGAKYHADYPLESQLAESDRRVTFSIVGKIEPNARHHWYFNGTPIDSDSAPALGVSNYTNRDLTIDHVSLTNCGFYSYESEEAVDGRERYAKKFSEIAELSVMFRSKPDSLRLESTNAIPPPSIVVGGTTVAGAGGGGTKCPGPYVAYVSYVNANDPSGGWYFLNGGQAYVASSVGNPEVYYSGAPSSNWGCSTNVPASKYPYRFRVYFRGSVPTGPVLLTLHPN